MVDLKIKTIIKLQYLIKNKKIEEVTLTIFVSILMI